MGWKIGIVTIIILAIIGYFGVAAYIAHSLTTPNPVPITFDETTISQRVADVKFKSKDGLPLSGWYFPGVNGNAIMFVHGAGNQNRVNDHYGTTEIAKHFVDNGYTVLMFDLRGAGESTQTRLGLGSTEAHDVAGAFEYLKTQDFLPSNITIISNSLGAIATIMGSENIKEAGAIILDSPATDVKVIVSNILEKEHSVPRFVHPAVYLWAKILYQIDIDKIRPTDNIHALLETPILFLHGEIDDLIPPENTEELLQKVENGKRITFQGAKHIETYKSDKKRYLKEVADFIEQNIVTQN